MARERLRSTIAKPRRRCHQAAPTRDSSNVATLSLLRKIQPSLHSVRTFSLSSALTVLPSPNTTTLLLANAAPICPNVSSGVFNGLIDSFAQPPVVSALSESRAPTTTSTTFATSARPMETSTISEPPAPLPAGKKEKEKRFQCPHCQRMFARLEHLQRHERIHSGIKPFSCAECNYSFTRR